MDLTVADIPEEIILYLMDYLSVNAFLNMRVNKYFKMLIHYRYFRPKNIVISCENFMNLDDIHNINCIRFVLRLDKTGFSNVTDATKIIGIKTEGYHINDSIKILTNIQKLRLNYSDFITNDEIKNLTNITKLTIYKPSIGDIGISNLTNITKLCIGSTSSNITSDGISKLTNITELVLNSHKITDSGIVNMSMIKKLKLNNLSRIMTTDILTNMTNLVNLSLRNNKTIRGDLNVLTNITKLDLSGSHVEYGQIKNLKLVSLKLIGKNNIHEELMNMTNLISLNLAFNTNITDDTLCSLTNLHKLDLCFNEIITNRGLSSLTRIDCLNLRYNTVITDIHHLTNITKLDIRHNHNISYTHCHKSINVVLYTE